MLPTVLILLIFSISIASSMTDDQVFHLVTKSCHHSHHYCPKKPYLLKTGSNQFNENAVMNSELVKAFKNEDFENKEEILKMFKNEFCCLSDSCMEHCGFYRVVEKDIVKKLPIIYKELFSLNFEELKEYESDYLSYLKNQQYRHHKKNHHHHHVPAEVEDLYDLLHKHEEKYRMALEEKKGIEF